MRNTAFKVICTLASALWPLICGAEPPLAGPLAYGVAPSCSQRPGVRSVRSDLIQLGDVTASIAAQSTRDGGSCLQNAALWVTQKSTSQQFDLQGAAQKTFAIVDIAPGASAILLSSTLTFSNSEDDHSAQLAFVSLSDGVLKWTSLADILGYKSCDASFEPQGFLDATHVLITALPRTSAHLHPSCVAAPAFFSFDAVHHTVKPSALSGVQRFAHTVAGPLLSCKSDPDVVGACYTRRGRLSMSANGESFSVWLFGETHLLAVEDGMLPGELLSQVAPNMRVDATMVLCPMMMERSSTKHRVCVDSATNLHPDPLRPRTPRAPTATTRPANTESGKPGQTQF